jgi:peptidoglycan/LPS O-acetylase OafA/YrhL
VLAVLLFHADLPVASGGVAGVTLFFVLSGYLIATLLLRERAETGAIDLSRFFARRAWRLLPALVAVTIALVILGNAAGDARGLAEDSLLTLAYLANWARTTGDAMGWWNHAWSLSVEEQFYLIAPLGFLILTRGRSPGSRAVIASLALAVVAAIVWRLALIESGASGARIYFGTDTRIDALLLGSLLAAVRIRHPDWNPGRVVGPVAVVTFVVLAALPLIDILGPGTGYALVAIASVGVVVGALRDHRGSAALASRPLVWLGERSYSLYLVHVPVFMYVNHVLDGVEPVVRIGTAVLVSVALSTALFRYVEQPFRHGLPQRFGTRGSRVVTADGEPAARMGSELAA